MPRCPCRAPMPHARHRKKPRTSKLEHQRTQFYAPFTPAVKILYTDVHWMRSWQSSLTTLSSKFWPLGSRTKLHSQHVKTNFWICLNHGGLEVTDSTNAGLDWISLGQLNKAACFNSVCGFLHSSAMFCLLLSLACCWNSYIPNAFLDFHPFSWPSPKLLRLLRCLQPPAPSAQSFPNSLRQQHENATSKSKTEKNSKQIMKSPLPCDLYLKPLPLQLISNR